MTVLLLFKVVYSAFDSFFGTVIVTELEYIFSEVIIMVINGNFLRSTVIVTGLNRLHIRKVIVTGIR